TDDLDHLCWCKLALDCWREAPKVEETLAEIDRHILTAIELRRQTGWLKPNCYREALTVLALGTGTRNFFRLVRGAGGSPAQDGRAGEPPAPRGVGVLQRVGNWFRRFTLKAVSNLRALPTNSAVHIARAPD